MAATQFTTSEGFRVVETADDVCLWTPGRVKYLGGGKLGAAVKEYITYRLETARAVEDERLGRWRWPENTEYVVHRLLLHRVRVTSERSGRAEDFTRADLDLKIADSFLLAARAYFDAHPEPKPWHEAKPGEVWVIATRNVGDECAVQVHADHFVYNDGSQHHLTYDAIESGRRIWPEDAS